MKKVFFKYQIFIAWTVSLTATLGSLFFSEVMEFTPCSLCWYQRIFMYPLAIILLIGFFREDRVSLFYGLIFSILGWLISFYHNLLVWEIIPETASPCVQGIPCNATYIDWFDFITIPLLSMMAFTLLIIICLPRCSNEK